MASVNSPLSSILKSASANRRSLTQSLQVRFETPTAQLDVAAILQEYIDGHNEARYIQLLGLKNDPNVNVRYVQLILLTLCSLQHDKGSRSGN